MACVLSEDKFKREISMVPNIMMLAKETSLVPTPSINLFGIYKESVAFKKIKLLSLVNIYYTSIAALYMIPYTLG